MTLTINFSKEQNSILEKALDLMSHALPDHKWADVITALAEKEIQRRTEIKRPRMVKKSNSGEKSTEDKKTSGGEGQSKAERLSQTDRPSEFQEDDSIVIETNLPAARKAIKPNLRKTIFAQDQCCQFKDPLTNKTCGSVRFLEIDHIQPVWAGGDNSPDNLRILCSLHNKFKYAQESGIHPVLW